MPETLRELIKELGKEYKDGSSTREGHVYHELPGTGAPFHRGGTAIRVEHIAKLVPLNGTRVLDIGCSVGGISHGLAMKGATVFGIDTDPAAIAVAREVCPEGEFIVGSVEETELPKVDVLVWLSQWMWSVKQHDREHGLKLLFDVPMRSRASVMIFESAAGDGKAKMKDVTQDTIKGWLEDYSIYTVVKDEGIPAMWLGTGNRHVFKCNRARNYWVGWEATVIRPEWDKVVKKYTPDGLVYKENDSRCLRRLEKYPQFPYILDEGDDYIIMEWMGNRAKKFHGLMEIVEILKQENIVHRDINPNNLLMKDGMLRLVDFGWAIVDGEEITPTPPQGLGRGYYEYGDWDDEKAARRVVG